MADNDSPTPGVEPEPTSDLDGGALPPELAAQAERIAQEAYAADLAATLGEVPRPINWRTLPPEDLEQELLELNAWVDWLRHEYGLPAQIVPPMWHRHPELLWELSALRQHWLASFDPQAKAGQALAWHYDFAIARDRLRDWVMISGTRLDRDRPTRITAWPGGEAEDWSEPSTVERPVTERSSDFLAFIEEQVLARTAEQEARIREITHIEWTDQP